MHAFLINFIIVIKSGCQNIKMENTSTDNDVQQSPPRRRRSTFFERRDSLVPQPFTENTDPNVCEKIGDVDDKCNEELLKYHDKLLSEKNQWKTEVKNRRDKYHDLRQQFQMAIKEPSQSSLPYSSLSNEDIEFLKGKVNISKLVVSQQNLHNSVKKTQELYRRVMELDDVLLSHCEQKVNEVTDYLLENSTIE